MAILDKTGCGGHWLHRRAGLHVRTVQSLRPAVAQAEGLQPRHLCAELPRHGQEAGQELVHREHGRQGGRGRACVTNGNQLTAICGGRPPGSHTGVTGPAGTVSLRARSGPRLPQLTAVILSSSPSLSPLLSLTHLSLLCSKRKGEEPSDQGPTKQLPSVNGKLGRSAGK